MKAIKRVKEDLPEIKVLFLGKYYPLSIKEDLQDYINKNNLTNHIELKDPVPYKEVAKYYQLSKIGLVLLKKVKTFEVSMPIKIFEYMAYGLPIIVSDFGHMKDYIENDSCGITVSPDNTKYIAAAVSLLLQDRDLYNKFSENGLKASLTKYRWEMEFDKLLTYYKKALDDR